MVETPIEFDGIVTPKKDTDPLAGMRLRSIFIDWATQTASVVLTYHRKSGAVSHEETLNINGSDFEPFAAAALTPARRKSAIKVLASRGRLSGVEVPE
jgi:hypothetical protein